MWHVDEGQANPYPPSTALGARVTYRQYGIGEEWGRHWAPAGSTSARGAARSPPASGSSCWSTRLVRPIAGIPGRRTGVPAGRFGGTGGRGVTWFVAEMRSTVTSGGAGGGRCGGIVAGRGHSGRNAAPFKSAQFGFDPHRGPGPARAVPLGCRGCGQGRRVAHLDLLRRPVQHGRRPGQHAHHREADAGRRPLRSGRWRATGTAG